MTDIPFEQALNVHEIELRLHPLDVGFDVRVQAMSVVLPAGARLRASYPREDGGHWVLEGPRAAVVARLRALGFELAEV